MCEKTGVLIALGAFDGLHIGHKKVLSCDTTEYKEKLALMFKEHPQKVLTGKAPGGVVTPAKAAELLAEQGFSARYEDFREISQHSPRDFVEKILVSKYGATALCCGFNYRFGKSAQGDVKLLEELCKEYGIKLTVCDEVDYEGLPVSSTRIRECIRNGDIKTANEMLGRDFSYDFEVVHGDARGRLLGAPTINQFFSEDFTVPKYGVYASYCIVDGKKYAAVTNIGIRPTIGNSAPRSETYIIDFSGDLYGRNIEVFPIEWIRGEVTFSSLEELSKQIACDRENSEKIMKRAWEND